MTILVIINILIGLLKVGFLVWIYVRTRILAAVIYAAYLVVGALGQSLISNFIVNAIAGPGDPAGNVVANILLAVRVVFALIETGLFVWLIQSLLNRSTPRDGR